MFSPPEHPAFGGLHGPAGPVTRAIILLLVAVLAGMAWKFRPQAPDPLPPGLSERKPLRQFELTEFDASYMEVVLHGWRVRVAKALLQADAVLALRVLNLLHDQLGQIQRVVPARALESLREVPVWLELQTPGLRGAQYHWSPDWLRSHGYDPRKGGAIEIASAADYLEWSRIQPSIIMHELAHAYNDRVLGRDHPELLRAYVSAGNRGLYESVAQLQGGPVRAYGLNNHLEFFAELSEAYFTGNDFFPFNREQLREYDAVGYAIVEALWAL